MHLVPVAITRIKLIDIIFSAIRSLFSRDLNSFEKECARICKKKEALYLTSLMRSSYVACLVAKRETGRNKILMPRYACPSFTHGILEAGMEIKYCDLVADTLKIDLASLPNYLSGDVAGLLVPNLFGYSSDLEKLKEICKAQQILLIEGADYTFGGMYNGIPFGTYGDITVLNFQEGKAIPIGGGMVLSDYAIKERELVRTGSGLLPFLRSIAFWLFSNPYGYFLFRKAIGLLNIGFRKFSMEDTIRETKDEFTYSFNKSEPLVGISVFQNLLALCLLKQMPAEMFVRCQNADSIVRQLLDLESKIKLVKYDSKLVNPHIIRVPILVPAEKRNKIIQHLFNNGFESSPMYSELGLTVNSDLYPGCSIINDSLLTLPCNGYMDQNSTIKLTSALREVIVD